MSENTSRRWIWKGKLVTKKVYEKRLKQVANAKKMNASHNLQESAASCKTSPKCSIEGRRIIHLETLADQLFCYKCDAVLSLQDCVSEKRIGLASIFHVKCRLCQTITDVNTDKTHEVPGGKSHYDVNTKTVAGSYSEYDQLNKISTQCYNLNNL